MQSKKKHTHTKITFCFFAFKTKLFIEIEKNSHPDTDIFAVTSRFWYLLAREIDDDSAKKQIFGPA